MALPERVRVKLLSEAAGYVTSTRVVQRDFALEELMEAIVAVAGKNLDRVVQLLRAGTIVVGDYRYRWTAIEATAADVEPLLARFPDPWPEREFQPDRCVCAIVRAGVEAIELRREEAARTRLFRKTSFWDVVLQLARERPPQYDSYSYRHRADVYALAPAATEIAHLREAAALLPAEGLAERLRRLSIDKILFLVNR